MPNHAFNLTRAGDLQPAHLRGLPDRSWWAEQTGGYEAFFRRAQLEQERMAQSPIGKSTTLVLGRDTERISRRDVGPANPSDLEMR